MKTKVFLVALSLMVSFQFAPAQANVRPTVDSFTFTPDDLDLSGVSTKVDFELVVSHPAGIETTKVDVTISNSRNDSVSAVLNRTDSPRETNRVKVTFKGGVNIPRDFMAGVYTIKATEVRNNSAAGYQYSTGAIDAPNIRTLVGAESGLLVRNFGELDFNYETFAGPTFDPTLSTSFNDTVKYNRNKLPIWKVGETFDPSNFFELRVPTLNFGITTTTPSICSTDGKLLKLISVGDCAFKVFTPKTNDYREKIYSYSVRVNVARIKIELVIDKIPNQTSAGLPKSLELRPVYSAASGYILPKSDTPQVCLAAGFFVRIISGGTCTLSYQSPDTATYRASDVYLQTFEIVRTPQTIEFAPSSTVDLKSKTLTLSASASSGAAVTFTAEPAANCSVTGTTLNLLKVGNCVVTAQQAGTTTIAPISKTVTISITGKAARELRTISCVKGSKKVSVTKAKPKCPKGYSRVR